MLQVWKLKPARRDVPTKHRLLTWLRVFGLVEENALLLDLAHRDRRRRPLIEPLKLPGPNLFERGLSEPGPNLNPKPRSLNHQNASCCQTLLHTAPLANLTVA